MKKRGHFDFEKKGEKSVNRFPSKTGGAGGGGRLSKENQEGASSRNKKEKGR